MVLPDSFSTQIASTWEQKIWGRVKHVFDSPDLAVSLLEVKDGFRCSRHLHHNRDNRFVVLSGKIAVWEWNDATSAMKNPSMPDDEHIVSDVTILAGRPHTFLVIESGIVVEIYTPSGNCPVRLDDIERLDAGCSIRC